MVPISGQCVFVTSLAAGGLGRPGWLLFTLFLEIRNPSPPPPPWSFPRSKFSHCLVEPLLWGQRKRLPDLVRLSMTESAWTSLEWRSSCYPEAIYLCTVLTVIGSFLVLDWCFLLLEISADKFYVSFGKQSTNLMQIRLMIIDIDLELVTVQAPRGLTYIISTPSSHSRVW